MSAFTPREEDIMDEVYFVISYADLAVNSGIPEPELQEGVIGLLQKGYLNQLEFNTDIGDYAKRSEADLDNVAGYHYVASKSGLLAHNSRLG